MQPQQFPCQQCGAMLEYAPGTSAQKCAYCGAANEIKAEVADTTEIDYHATLRGLAESSEQAEVKTLSCGSCGAVSSVREEVRASVCPFCGSSLVTAGTTRAIKCKAMLPFNIDEKQSRRLFETWVRGLWFAPNALKRLANVEGRIAGIYVPYWTFDARTETRYRGQRGEHYYVTESYTTTVNGRSETRTRQVQKTRWYAASGTVRDDFDDLLVMASKSLPRAYAEKLEPWDLENLVACNDAYLAGFVAESYGIGLEPGFEIAKERMQPTILSTCRQDIGGDEQRVDSTSTSYDGVTFKHVLLPVWLAAYRYHQKTFRFLVNGRTGEVQGERPYSWVKITFAVLAGIVVLIVLFVLFGGENLQNVNIEF